MCICLVLNGQSLHHLVVKSQVTKITTSKDPNYVNVSVEHYLFMFSTFHCGSFGKSVAISAQALQTDLAVMPQQVSNCYYNA